MRMPVSGDARKQVELEGWVVEKKEEGTCRYKRRNLQLDRYHLASI
jgi:hypothetical protein